MLNIISRSIVEGGINGPQKVVSNLIKGLDIIGYPYCINKELNATSQLWIHDDTNALTEVSNRNLKAIVGPNLYVLPRNIPNNINFSNIIYIQPSKWVADFWRQFGFNKCEIATWPAGIDTTYFSERLKPENGIVLIYFKQRFAEELSFIINILDRLKINHHTIIYGLYKQNKYLEKLKNTKYIIWIGRQESQGIALEEALSMNVPILVWDVLSVGHWSPNINEIKIFNDEENYYQDATSAYYFDERCGLRTKEKTQIEDSVLKMERMWQHFEPRKYILENLSLEKQAKDFVSLYEKYNIMSYDLGFSEKIISDKNWINAKLYYRVYLFSLKTIKRLINKINRFRES